jgi:glycosyltransferase involved in cell wall biosynthesis
MKIVFFSNFLNHHQLPFCLEMVKLLGENNFIFVANESTNLNCLALGYEEMNDKYSFVLKTYEDSICKQKALSLALICDVAIIGGGSDEYRKLRLKKNKITFDFTERFLKEGRLTILKPRVFFEIFLRFTRYRYRNLYVLCAGGFVAGDIQLVGFQRKKCFKWGYFTEVKLFEDINMMITKKVEISERNNKKVSILWVARYISLKHPEMPIRLAKLLKDNGYSFEINMLGKGELEQEMDDLINTLKVKDCVNVLGVRPNKDVRIFMEHSQIFLFTSDSNEGWGAVLNEAMNSACACVVDKRIGSAPYLIEDGTSGLLYDGTVEQLYEKVKLLFENPKLRESISLNAYRTMKENWNAYTASKNLLQLICDLEAKGDNSIKIGPCSQS